MKPLECSRLNGKNRVQAGEENLVVNSVKSGRKIQQNKNRNVVIVQSGKNITSVKRAHKARTCWYRRPFCLIYRYQVKEKHKKIDRHNIF